MSNKFQYISFFGLLKDGLFLSEPMDLGKSRIASDAAVT